MQKSKIAKLIAILFKIILILGVICLPFISKLYDVIKIFDMSFSSQPLYYKIMFYITKFTTSKRSNLINPR